MDGIEYNRILMAIMLMGSIEGEVKIKCIV